MICEKPIMNIFLLEGRLFLKEVEQTQIDLVLSISKSDYLRGPFYGMDY